MLLLTFSGLVNRHQADIISYLVEENRVLKEQLKGRRLRLNDDVERAHQGLGNERIEASESGTGEVQCTERLGGILEHYSRAA